MNNTKNLIDNISFKLFLEKGYEATNIRDICQEVGIKPSSLYFYYPSKEAIFFNIYDDIWKERLTAIVNIIESNPDKSPNEILYDIFKGNVSGKIFKLINHKFLLRYHLFPTSELLDSISERYQYWAEKEREIFSELFIKCSKLNVLPDSILLKKYYKKYKTYEYMIIGESLVSGLRLSDEEINFHWNNFSSVLQNNN